MPDHNEGGVNSTWQSESWLASQHENPEPKSRIRHERENDFLKVKKDNRRDWNLDLNTTDAQSYSSHRTDPELAKFEIPGRCSNALGEQDLGSW